MHFNEETSRLAPILRVNKHLEKTDYEYFIIEFKRPLEHQQQPGRKKQASIAPTNLVPLYLIRHGATISSIGDKSLSGKAAEMPHVTFHNPKLRSSALADSSLL